MVHAIHLLQTLSDELVSSKHISSKSVEGKYTQHLKPQTFVQKRVRGDVCTPMIQGVGCAEKPIRLAAVTSQL